ncbi:MAG: hypothetical protein EP332_08755 [Bacteroidetes bacterium]|nr:MAG: hypothetical protein EP332_08755 [Bacteroidota bacterium]
MKTFPPKQYRFKFKDSASETMERLKNRTLNSEMNLSTFTDKSMIGTVSDTFFKVNSTLIGIGAFCVMSGQVDSEEGQVSVQVNKVFKGFIYFFYIMPFLAMIPAMFDTETPFSLLFLIGPIVMIAFIRFVFVELAFRFASSEGLKRLSDILQVELIKE